MNIEEMTVYENARFAVLRKPAGVAVRQERGFREDLLDAFLTRRKQKREPVYGALINRLDQPVGGLVLIAKDRKTAAALSAMTQERLIEKKYYAVVSGTVLNGGEWTDYLFKDAKKNYSKTVPDKTAGAKQARLSYEPIEQKEIDGKPYTLVRVSLHTGRHHQIRVQFAARGHGLYGDMKYNPDFADRPGATPALYAYRLSFPDPADAAPVTVEVQPEETPDGEGRNIWAFAYFA